MPPENKTTGTDKKPKKIFTALTLDTHLLTNQSVQIIDMQPKYMMTI